MVSRHLNACFACKREIRNWKYKMLKVIKKVKRSKWIKKFSSGLYVAQTIKVDT